MQAILKTTDMVTIDYAANLLGQEGIETVIFDAHACVMDGSTGFLPRRLMVLDDDYPRALALLRVAMPEQLSAEQLRPESRRG